MGDVITLASPRCANCLHFTPRNGPYGTCEKYEVEAVNTDFLCDDYVRSIRPERKEPAHDLAR
jgi:hypothetical protein